MVERYGAQVTRLEVEWGRACDPDRVRRALETGGADIVALVHGETSTGVLNPVADIAAVAAQHGALTIVDAVTTLGAVNVDTGRWGVDVCYSCTQKGLGAPSGLAPICFSARALKARVACRSFYLDLALLEDYWLRRKYHHTISAPLIYAAGAHRHRGRDVTRSGRPATAPSPGVGRRSMRSGYLLLPPGPSGWTLSAVRDRGRQGRRPAQAPRVRHRIGAGLDR